MDDLLKVAVGMLLASLALAWVATFARLIVLRSIQIRIQDSGALVRAHGSAAHVTALYGLLRRAHPAPNSGMLDGGDRRLHESEPIHIPCPQSRCDTDMVAQDLQGREFPHHNYRERLDRLDDLSGSWLIQIGDCGRAPAGLNKRLLTGWNGCNMFETHLYGRGCRGSVGYARRKALRFVRYAIALRGAGAALHPFSPALGKISVLPSIKTIEWE
jgi:hypothetical protein